MVAWSRFSQACGNFEQAIRLGQRPSPPTEGSGLPWAASLFQDLASWPPILRQPICIPPWLSSCWAGRIFTFLMFLGTFRATMALTVVFALLLLTFLALTIAEFGGGSTFGTLGLIKVHNR